MSRRRESSGSGEPLVGRWGGSLWVCLLDEDLERDDERPVDLERDLARTFDLPARP
jgi:hypothetical protein